MRFIASIDVKVGMVNSMGQTIIDVKHTAKQVHLTTISRVDGQPMIERISKSGKIVVQS